MTNKIFAVSATILLFACMALAGCTVNSSTSAETAAPAPPLTTSAPTSESACVVPQNGLPAYTDGFINHDLLALLGTDNASLKEHYDSRCYAYTTPMGAGVLEYYQPYISIFFSIPDGPMLQSGQDDRMVYGVHEANPFVDDMVITAIHLQGDFDSENQQITGQDSLQQFFMTDEEITYALLNDELRQTPDLEHYEDVGIDPIFECDYDSHRRAVPVDGGAYFAEYTIDEVSVFVKFIQQADGYTAVSVDIG